MAQQIQFGGRTRTLKFGLRECALLEDRLGADGMLSVARKLQGLSVNTIVACLVVGLAHEEASINANLVTKYLEEYTKTGTAVELANTLWEALQETGLFNVDAPTPGNKKTATA